MFLELSARARTEYVQPAVLAVAAEHAGKRREALDYLRRAVEIRDPVLGAFALYSPPMAKLRAVPEFWAVLDDLGWKSSTLGAPRAAAAARSRDPEDHADARADADQLALGSARTP